MITTTRKELWITLRDKRDDQEEFWKSIDVTGKTEGEIEELKNKAVKSFGAAYNVEFDLQEI